jgi:hypothetical protein
MFGHDNNQDHDDAAANDGIDAAADAIANDDNPHTDAPAPGTLGSFMATAPVTPDPQQDSPAPADPVTPSLDQPDSTAPDEEPGDTVAPTHDTSHDDTAPAPTPAEPVDTDGLLDIKHQALEDLTPLVGQLQQTPEEEFRTTMMMIQASDNASLIQKAYEAAKKIGNDKDRAQALLDIVNEINYFTRQG